MTDPKMTDIPTPETAVPTTNAAALAVAAALESKSIPYKQANKFKLLKDGGYEISLPRKMNFRSGVHEHVHTLTTWKPNSDLLLHVEPALEGFCNPWHNAKLMQQKKKTLTVTMCYAADGAGCTTEPNAPLCNAYFFDPKDALAVLQNVKRGADGGYEIRAQRAMRFKQFEYVGIHTDIVWERLPAGTAVCAVAAEGFANPGFNRSLVTPEKALIVGLYRADPGEWEAAAGGVLVRLYFFAKKDARRVELEEEEY